MNWKRKDSSKNWGNRNCCHLENLPFPLFFKEGKRSGSLSTRRPENSISATTFVTFHLLKRGKLKGDFFPPRFERSPLLRNPAPAEPLGRSSVTLVGPSGSGNLCDACRVRLARSRSVVRRLSPQRVVRRVRRNRQYSCRLAFVCSTAPLRSASGASEPTGAALRR